MLWAEVDLDAATWNIPGDRMKAGKAHQAPLSDAAVAILREQQLKARGRNPHVFPGRLPLRELSVNALSFALERLGAGQYTVHGMRAAFRSWCADTGVAYPGRPARPQLPDPDRRPRHAHQKHR